MESQRVSIFSINIMSKGLNLKYIKNVYKLSQTILSTPQKNLQKTRTVNSLKRICKWLVKLEKCKTPLLVRDVHI